jgi:multidrug efflux pump subunit AcrB
MKYLPITLIATLAASLAVALFFTPTLGALLGKTAGAMHGGSAKGRAGRHGDKDGPYLRTVRLALRHSGATLAWPRVFSSSCSLPTVDLGAASSSSRTWSPITAR